jgi:dolichol kinase
MTDLTLGAIWLGVLVAGIGGCVVLHAFGVASTYIRDVLHIGAGVWIAGWPLWHGDVVPIAIVTMAAVITAALPAIARHDELARKIVTSVTNGEEHWTGLVHYTAVYAVFTAIGEVGEPFPAAAALLSLSLGDGIGGAIGRAFGRHRYRAPGAKMKSLEGSVAVFLAATAGAFLAMHLCHRDIAVLPLLGLGLVASVAEALAPRGTDNLLIPIAVWTAATVMT